MFNKKINKIIYLIKMHRGSTTSQENIFFLHYEMECTPIIKRNENVDGTVMRTEMRWLKWQKYGKFREIKITTTGSIPIEKFTRVG